MMNENAFYLIVYIWIAIAILIFPFVLKFIAPYGRHTSNKWGGLLPNRLGWIIMESPALLFFSFLFLFGKNSISTVPFIFFSLWVIHYLNRTIIFPFRLKTKEKKCQLPLFLWPLVLTL